MSPPEIRPARPQEAPALAAMARAAYGRYVERLGFEPPAMTPDFPAAIGAGEVWVMGDPPLAYVIARAEGTDWFVDNVARGPDAPRGAGRRMLAFAEAEGARRGHRRVTLYTNIVMTENQALYPRLGYAETGRRRWDRVAVVDYAKPLTAED